MQREWSPTWVRPHAQLESPTCSRIPANLPSQKDAFSWEPPLSFLISAISADFVLLLAPLMRHEMFRTFAHSRWKRNALQMNWRESLGEVGSSRRLRT